MGFVQEARQHDVLKYLQIAFSYMVVHSPDQQTFPIVD